MLNPATSYSPRCSPCLDRHWAAAWGNLTKYNLCTFIEDDQRVGTLQMESEQDWFSGSSHEKQRLQNT